jgi:hypothetical protein
MQAYPGKRCAVKVMFFSARRTFVGVVELQPTRLLEDGLRAHLAQRAAAAAATALSFRNPPAPLAYPPLSAAGRSALAGLFGAGASLSASIPGRCARSLFCSLVTDALIAGICTFETHSQTVGASLTQSCTSHSSASLLESAHFGIQFLDGVCFPHPSLLLSLVKAVFRRIWNR